MFSIIIPCYNQAQFVGDCYWSLVAQTYSNWEAIFVNDGSTDATAEIIADIAKWDTKVKIVTKTNGGLSSARNAGIAQCSGDFLIFLDADDSLLPECLRELHHQITANPQANLLQVGYNHISENGATIFASVMPTLGNALLPSILYQNIGPVHSMCIHKKLVAQVGFFNESLPSCEDWDFWMRVAFLPNIYAQTISIPLVNYRLNSASMSRNGFVLYQAMKTVALEAKKRATPTMFSEKEFENGLKQKLVMCLGLSVMQNKIAESVALYQQETAAYNWQFTPNDCKRMSSYLSFRYLITKTDCATVLQTYKPRFEAFFSGIEMTEQNKKAALWAVFAKHYYYFYQAKVGLAAKLLHQLKLQLV